MFGVVVLALGLRLWGINFGLPSLYHPDEPNYVAIAQHIFKTGDLNPHFFNYPSLFFYINALAYAPYFLVGKLLGAFQSPHDIAAPVIHQLGVGATAMPSTFLMGRLITVLFGVGVVVLIYFAGKLLFKRPEVGLLAALVTAVSPANVLNSRFMTPNVQLSFFITLSVLGAGLVLERGHTRYYVLAAVGAGLTAATKYNGALIIVTLVAAHFLRYGRGGLRDWRIYLAPVLNVALFLAATPYALLDSAKFLNDIRQEATHYSTAHFGMEGDALGWYVDYLWTVEGFIVVAAVLQIGRGLLARSRPVLMLSLFPAIYFVFISTFVVRNDRTLMPVLPFLALLGSAFLLDLPLRGRLRGRLRGPFARRLATGLTAAAVCLTVAYPLVQTVIRSVESQAGVASRDTAREWINHTLPPGSFVGVETYGSTIDDRRFRVAWLGRITDHPISWYTEQGYDYIVFSGGIYNRFFRDPARYPNDVRLYNDMFAVLQPVRTFPGEVYEIRVYKAPGGTGGGRRTADDGRQRAEGRGRRAEGGGRRAV